MPMNLLESLPTVIGTAAVAPALLLLWLVIAADERPGPPAKVWTAFLLGAASISLLGVVRAPFASILAAPENPWVARAVHSVFGVALPEETVKILVIVAVSLRRRPFADPMDTVVYGAAAGLGFAAYENLAYLVRHAEMWQSLAALRSVLTVPFHGALGIIAGAYLAMGRAGTALGAHRHHRDWARISSRILMLFAPLALHAAFDFPRHRGIHQANPGSGQRADRIQRDCVCDPPGAEGRPSSRAPHRNRTRAAKPVATDVGIAGGGRRRWICRSGLYVDDDQSLAGKPRS
jgi:RsiW-degrading membrane proteinase PrsW (M82 family)